MASSVQTATERCSSRAIRLIAAATARTCAYRFGTALRAVVLTGSLARGEGKDAALWDRYVEAAPGSSNYHRWRWGQAIAQTFGHATYPFVAIEGGAVSGVLPLVFMRSLLFGRWILHREFPAARLVLVGNGALPGELEQRVAAVGLRESVHLAGYQRNVADWLALADFTILPSFYEGLPLSTIESLAAGRPVVAAAVDGTVDVVVHEHTGLLAPPGDCV
jgi:hypothetical protein